MGKNTITPRLLKGFRDTMPEMFLRWQRLRDRLERVFRLFAFCPIDTPILEYADILLGKGGGETEKKIYRFEDAGGRDVALRFDLTLPLARFVASHREELAFPFRRYQFGKVFRGENPQNGRYREFMQCDFDIIGCDAAQCDFDVILLVARALMAIEAPEFTIRVSDRSLLQRWVESRGIGEREVDIARIVDKIDKIGRPAALEQLGRIVSTSLAGELMSLIEPRRSNDETLRELRRYIPGADTGRIESVLTLAAEAGIADRIVVSPAITRGLDYYTGVIFETTLNDYPEIGSISSGGRYDNLIGLYGKTSLPGVGGSIGVDRLLAAVPLHTRSEFKPAVLIFCLDARLIGRYCILSEWLRNNGIACQVYPEAIKLGRQLQYAERAGYAAGLFCGDDEAEVDALNIRNIATSAVMNGLPREKALAAIRSIISEYDAR